MTNLLVRWGTQDVMMASEVYDQNEYALPDEFDPDDRIIDIGAHIGTFAKACIDRGCGYIHCYEPDPCNYELLLQNALPRSLPDGRRTVVRVFKHPVWYCGRTLTLFYPGDDPILTAMPQVRIPHSPYNNTILAIDIKEVLGKHVVTKEPIRLLKIDAEGAEVPILEGVTSMDNVQEITGELHYNSHFAGFPQPTNEWLEKRLKKLGFSNIWLRPNPHTESLSVFWGRR